MDPPRMLYRPNGCRVAEHQVGSLEGFAALERKAEQRQRVARAKRRSQHGLRGAQKSLRDGDDGDHRRLLQSPDSLQVFLRGRESNRDRLPGLGQAGVHL